MTAQTLQRRLDQISLEKTILKAQNASLKGLVQELRGKLKQERADNERYQRTIRDLNVQ